ncbi:MAG: protein kinase [Verrucomicrobiales bacterium]|nr:protein kinase [Verrucomicrobiales bacterium]
MTASAPCPQCGRQLRLPILEGLCPACVARHSLGVQRVVAIADSAIASQLAPGVPLLPKTLMIGKYEVESEIARGGMGVVYRARQPGLNRKVALKLLLAGQFADSGQVKRFLAEAETVARLDHSAIVPVYETGEFEGHHYFSMRLIEGPSLAKAMEAFALTATVRRVKQEGLPLRPHLRKRQMELAGFMADVARAVHYAHQRGVLHRDLKPGNVLLDGQGHPHITDFGLARFMDRDGVATRSGMVFGTPAYMPPEQTVDPHNVTVAADVYSLGAIAYELLTGRPPFEAGTPVETVIQVRQHEPIRPRSLEPGIDRDLETIVLKCLEKDPPSRYGTALALAEDLDRFIAGEPVLARPVGAAGRVFRWARRRPAVASLAAALAVLVVTLAFGGPLVAYRFRDQVQKNERLNEQYLTQLQSAKVAQAGSDRLRGEAGHREGALEAVRAAAEAGTNLAVLNEAVAQLARFDVSRNLRSLPEAGVDLPTACSIDFNAYYQMVPGVGILAHAMDGGAVLWAQTNLARSTPVVLEPCPDNQHLAVIQGRSLNLIRSSDGGIVWTVPAVNFCGFNPDGRWVLIQDSDREFRRIDVATGDPLPFPLGFRWMRSEIAMHPNPKVPVLARLWGSEIQFYDWEKDQTCGSLTHASPLQKISWQDNRIAASDHDDGVMIWVLPSPTPIQLRERIPNVYALQFIPNSPLLLVITEDGRASCWNTDDGERMFTLSGFIPKQISADGLKMLVSVARERRLMVTDLISPIGRVRFQLPASEKPSIRQVQFSPDARFVAAVKQDGLHLIDLSSHQTPGFHPLFGAVSCFFLPGTNVCVVQGRRSVEWLQWAPSGGAPKMISVRRLSWPDDAFLEPGAFAEGDSTLVVPRSYVGLEFLSLVDGSLVGRIANPSLGVAPSLDRSGRWVLVRTRDTKKTPVLLEVDGAVPSQPRFLGDFVPRFSPDGEWMLASSLANHRIYSTRRWADSPRDVLLGVERPEPLPAAWSRDSRWVAVCNDFDRILIWDVPKAKEVLQLTTQSPTRYSALCFSPGGRWLAAGTDRGQLELWDLQEMDRGLEGVRLNLEMTVTPEEAARDAVTWGAQRAEIQLPEARRSGPLRRDPKAQPAQLDLSAFYNARLDQSWGLLDPDLTQDSLVQLPPGLREYDGILFDVRGVLQLRGERFLTQPSSFPSRAEGIPVGRPVRKVHLLAAAMDAPGSVTRGVEIAWLRLNFRGGGAVDLPLALGVHLEDHLIPVVNPRQTEMGRIAWRGLNPGSESLNPPRFEVLYHVTLENPNPDQEVVSLDLISAQGTAIPFVVGITVE